MGSKDGQDTLSSADSLKEDKMERDSEQVVEEVPKKNSSIRFRRKSKQPKKCRSKGLCSYVDSEGPVVDLKLVQVGNTCCTTTRQWF